MKKLFSNKCSLLLIEVASSLLVLSAMVTILISTSQAAYAQTIPQNCTNMSQNYLYSNIWPSVGPQLLKEISQELTTITKHTIEAQQIYLVLTPKNNCSLATFVQKNTMGIHPSQAYQFEKHILTTVQSQMQGKTVPDVHQGLRWLISQNQTFVDNWISSAILTHPNDIQENNATSSTLKTGFRTTDYQNALSVFCNIFQRDITTYLYGSATPVHLQTMLSDLRSGAGNSVSALALGLGAGTTNPQTISPDLFEKNELVKAKQLIDSKPGSITPCPGSQSPAQAKVALDDFFTHEMPKLSISDLDSFFSQATLFTPNNSRLELAN